MQIVITQEFSNIKASRSSTGPTKTKKKNSYFFLMSWLKYYNSLYI